MNIPQEFSERMFWAFFTCFCVFVGLTLLFGIAEYFGKRFLGVKS